MKIDRVPGLSTASDAFETGFEGLVTGDNVDISKQGSVSRRKGFTQIYAGNIAAAWGDGTDCIFVEDNVLKRLNTDYTVETLRTGLAAVSRLTACRAYGRLYWNTDADSGTLDGSIERPIGLPQPASPVLTQVAGNLPSGRYLVAWAFVNSRGEEGPLSEHVVFDGVGGFSAPAPTTSNTEVVGVSLYLSGTNGEQLYLGVSADLTTLVTLVYNGDASDLVVPPENEHRAQLPIGTKLVCFGGRLWTGLSNVLVYSDPFSEHTDIRSNFIPVSGRLQDFGAVDNGLFVATDEGTYFFRGRDPEEMEIVRLAAYGAIPGTMQEVDGRLLGTDPPQNALMWASPRGICAGLPTGAMLNLTERKVNNLAGEQGTAVIRQENGQSHFVAVIQY